MVLPGSLLEDENCQSCIYKKFRLAASVYAVKIIMYAPPGGIPNPVFQVQFVIM